MTIDITARPHNTTDAPKTMRRQPSAADREPAKFNRRRRIIEISLAILVPTVIIGLWQIGSVNNWWDRRLFPAPSDAWTSARRQFANRGLATDIGYTLRRMLWGYFWGCSLGLIFAFVLGLSRTIRAAFEPMFNGLYTVPKILRQFENHGNDACARPARASGASRPGSTT